MITIRQVYNSCGIACVLMGLKPNKNKRLDEILRKLEKKITKKLKISDFRYGFTDRVQFAVTWLIFKVLFSENALKKELKKILPEFDDIKSLVISKLDEMLIYQSTRPDSTIEKDLKLMYNKGKVTYNLLKAYLEEQKTHFELMLLGSIFGMKKVQIAESEGGNPLGLISEVDPRDPETYVKKVETLSKNLLNGIILANYEYHWLVLRRIGSRIEKFTKEEQETESAKDLEFMPHYFIFNNPLSTITATRVKKIELMTKYNFYCFDVDLKQQEAGLKLIKSEFKL